MATTVAPAVAKIVVRALNTDVLDPDVPDDIMGAILTICTALAGYLTPPASRDRIVT